MATAGTDGEQSIERGELRVRQSGGERAPQLAVRPGPDLSTEAFEGRQRWNHDALRPQRIQRHRHERGARLGGQRRWQERSRQFTIPSARERPVTERGLDFRKMRPPRLVAFGIIGETRRIERQLFGHESQHRDRWRFALPQGPPWKSQVTEQDGEPESIGIATPPIDQRQILGIQGVMTDDPALVESTKIRGR